MHKVPASKQLLYPRVVPAAQPSGLERLVEDYLSSCRARGLSPRSMRAYSQPLFTVFLPWCAAEGITEVGQLDQRALDRLTAGLLDRRNSGRQLSKFSVAAYVRPVRQLLSWAKKDGEQVSGTPQLPRLPRRIRDVLTREEIARLEDAAVTERDRLIIRLLADTGMRVGELVTLRPEDLTRRGRDTYLRVMGKGDRDRFVPIPPGLARRLERQIRSRALDSRSEKLFLSLRRGHDGEYGSLTVSGVSQLLAVAAERAGLRERRVHPHALRHAFITNALRGGMNPLVVKQIVGHESLRMIESVYAHLTDVDAHAAMIRLFSTEAR